MQSTSADMVCAKRRQLDKLAGRAACIVCAALLSIALLMGYGLYRRASPVLAATPLGEIIRSVVWQPTAGRFGLGSFIAGTLWVTGIAVSIAVPLSILTSIYLSEYADRRVRSLVSPVIDVLAGISPVIYGFWGMIAVVPLVRDHLMPCLSNRLPFFPFKSDNYTGFSALTGGIVLAVMIIPVMVSVIGDVLRAVPATMREASLALGATKWQTVKYVAVKRAWPGIVAATILGLSRAFGETIAVLMVAGCALGILPHSIFDPAYPLPAFIANTYGEMMSIPLYDAAVLMAAFVLFVVTMFFNMIGWSILLKAERGGA